MEDNLEILKEHFRDLLEHLFKRSWLRQVFGEIQRKDISVVQVVSGFGSPYIKAEEAVVEFANPTPTITIQYQLEGRHTMPLELEILYSEGIPLSVRSSKAGQSLKIKVGRDQRLQDTLNEIDAFVKPYGDNIGLVILFGNKNEETVSDFLDIAFAFNHVEPDDNVFKVFNSVLNDFNKFNEIAKTDSELHGMLRVLQFRLMASVAEMIADFKQTNNL